MMWIAIFAALLLLSAPGAAQSPKVDRPQIGGVEVELRDGVGQETLDSERLFALVAPSVYVVRAGESYEALDRGFQGSAVAIQPHRLLTNCHVVRNSRAIYVVSEGWTVPAKLEMQDDATDRCILWVDTRLKPMKAIRTYASLRIGERVYSIGAPHGLELTIGEGLISGKREGNSLRLVQTSAPISPGSSGGGLFDQYGNLVGITTFILRESQNINFAIPAEDFASLGSQPPRAAPQPSSPPPREKPPAPEVAPPSATPPLLAPGLVFRECAECPEMVVIPPGSFIMGSPATEVGRYNYEGPQHSVTISKSFALGRFEINRGQWAAFVQATNYAATAGCVYFTGKKWIRDPRRSWLNPGFDQTDTHPVVCISKEDAAAFVSWLGHKTGHTYRLPSETEWEFAARAGTVSLHPWPEDREICRMANIGDTALKRAGVPYPRLADCNDGYAYTAPVGLFPNNRFGLFDMIGNVWEWTEDCWLQDYGIAPFDETPVRDGCNCKLHTVRGAGWTNPPGDARSAVRVFANPRLGYNYVGFRVARDLGPGQPKADESVPRPKFNALTDADVRRLFPAGKVEKGKEGALVFSTWRNPELILGATSFTLKMFWNGLDDKEWPMGRILGILVNAACGATSQDYGKMLIDELFATPSLIPPRDLGGNAGFAIRHYLRKERYACSITLTAEGGRWNVVTATVSAGAR